MHQVEMKNSHLSSQRYTQEITPLGMSHTSADLFQRLKLFLDKQEEWPRTLHRKLLGDLCAFKYFYRVSSQKRNFLVTPRNPSG